MTDQVDRSWVVTLGVVVRELRRERGLTITQIPGVASSTLDRIEKAQQADTKLIGFLVPLAAAFGMRVSELVDLVEQRVAAMPESPEPEPMSPDEAGEHFGA